MALVIVCGRGQVMPTIAVRTAPARGPKSHHCGKRELVGECSGTQNPYALQQLDAGLHHTVGPCAVGVW